MTKLADKTFRITQMVEADNQFLFTALDQQTAIAVLEEEIEEEIEEEFEANWSRNLRAVE